MAVPAPLVISVLMRSSCPYRAAMCRGVFPFLSLQSISAPTHTEKHMTLLDSMHFSERIQRNRRLTVLNDRLRSREPSMDCSHVQRCLTILTLCEEKKMEYSRSSRAETSITTHQPIIDFLNRRDATLRIKKRFLYKIHCSLTHMAQPLYIYLSFSPGFRVKLWLFYLYIFIKKICPWVNQICCLT